MPGEGGVKPFDGALSQLCPTAKPLSRCVTLPKGCIVRAVPRILAVILFIAGMGFVPASAFASTERVLAKLDWHRTEVASECLEASALTAGVEARLQRKVFVLESQADIKIHVSLDAPSPGNWTASIDLDDRNDRPLGHRELTIRGEHCSALDESLALMVVLMVDVTRESVQAEAAEPKPPASSLKQPDNPPSTPPELDSRSLEISPLRYRMHLLGSLRNGQQPGIGRGITLKGELSSSEGWSALLSVAIWPSRERSEDGLGARFWLATAEANACGSLASSRSHDISLCAGYQAGLLNSRAFGFEVNDHKETLIQDLTLRFCATWWATASYGLHGTLGVALPLMQDEFFGTRDDGSRLRLLSRAAIIPLADLGISVRFGS